MVYFKCVVCVVGKKGWLKNSYQLKITPYLSVAVSRRAEILAFLSCGDNQAK
jgi:hypothetical protein